MTFSQLNQVGHKQMIILVKMANVIVVKWGILPTYLPYFTTFLPTYLPTTTYQPLYLPTYYNLPTFLFTFLLTYLLQHVNLCIYLLTTTYQPSCLPTYYNLPTFLLTYLLQPTNLFSYIPSCLFLYLPTYYNLLSIIYLVRNLQIQPCTILQVIKNFLVILKVEWGSKKLGRLCSHIKTNK